MIDIKDLNFKRSTTPKGVSATVKFPNGFGASIVSNDMSYGGKAGLFEIAVVDSKGNLTSDTDITDNVLGWLDEKDVERTLDAIRQLDSNGNLPNGVKL